LQVKLINKTMIFKSINPYDSSVVAEHPVLSDSELQNVLQKSEKAFRDWRKTSFAHRADLFKNVIDILNKNKEKYALLITTEMGKILPEAQKEIEKSIINCEYYLENTQNFLQDEIVKVSTAKSMVAYDPIGAIFAIMPWNFPFWQVFRYAAPALMAGNVTLLKHAPNVCGCAKAIEQIFLEAGFPEGVFQSIIIDIPQVEGVIASNIVQGITLTGSEYAGSSVAALAGKHIKKSVLELGGSDAFIVLPNADIDKAVKVGLQSRMINAGQACNCAKRFILLDKIHDEFVEKMTQNIAQIKYGNPLDSTTNIGPLARLDLAQKIENQVVNSIKSGATDKIKGERNGNFYKPTLLTNIASNSPAFDEEMFGPVATIFKVKTEAEAIHLANNHRYGLAGSVWTKDVEKGYQIARQLDTGNVFVNALVKSDSRLPFGGVKKSGYGRELSHQGLREFMNLKTIWIEN
jgi:succinate-semialdehyde dehydrogenase / glutarate-semialdehyde dehydrogenase